VIIKITAPGRFVLEFDTDDPALSDDETITVEVDGEPILGITNTAVGYWPDGEQWEVLT